MKYLILILSFLVIQLNTITVSFASETNILGVDDDVLRKGEIDITTIPGMIAALIQFVIGIAGTMAIVALIYNAVQMQLHSGITGDSSGVDKAKKGMFGALMGFVVTILAWFIVSRVIQILVSST